MGAWIREGRLAVRGLLRTPRQSAFVLVVLALALGGNAALFTLLDALVLRPLAVPGAERLVMFTALDQRGTRRLIPLTTIAEIERQQQSFEALAGYTSPGVFAGEVHGAAVPISLETMAGNFYDVLGVRPAVGRLISHDESMPGVPVPTVAVISHSYWQREFRGAPDVIGQQIRIQTVPITIVGVTPATFPGIYRESRYDVMTPLTTTALFSPVGDPRFGVRIGNIVGKLRQGVSLRTAEAELRRLWPVALEASMPASVVGDERGQLLAQTFEIKPFATGFSTLRDRYETSLWGTVWLMVALLALAALNVGALFLARAVARQRELCVRLDLGASRRDLTRQFVAEAAVWCSAAALAAIPAGWWLSRGLATALWTGTNPVEMSFVPGLRAWLLIGGSIVGTTMAIGLVPSWVLIRRVGEHRTLTRTASRATGRWGKGLLVVQLAMSLALVFVAAVLARGFSTLSGADPGYDGSRVQLVSVSGQAGAYRDLNEAAYYPELVKTLEALPGVERVGLTRWFARIAQTLTVPPDPVGVEGDAPEPRLAATVDYFSPGVFDTLGIALTAGRDFDWRDTTTAPPVAILTADLAERLFPGGAALGRRIVVGEADAVATLEVIGVARPYRPVDVRMAEPFVIRPSLQRPAFARIPIIVVRTTVPLGAEDYRMAIAPLGREYVTRVQTLPDRRDGLLARERVTAYAAFATASLGLLLAGSGVYSLLAWLLAQRTREFGIRSALGASRGTLRTMVIGEAMLLAAIGVVIGVPTALGAGRLLSSALPDLAGWDPASLAVSGVVLAAAGLLAGVGPALRIGRTDPIVALRSE